MGKTKNNKVVNFSQYAGYTKKNKQKKQKKISFVPLIIFLLLVFAIGCFCIFTDVFNIEKIEVKGINVAYVSTDLDNIQDLEDVEPNENKTVYLTEEGMSYYSIDDIISISGITLGNNMFKEDLSEAIEKIESAPYVKSASIVRKFPSTLLINVEERIFKAFVDYVGSYVCIDDTGYIVNIINKSQKTTNHPCIIGITPKDIVKGFVVGETLNADDPIKLQRIVNLLNLIDKNQLQIDIETINISNVDEVIVNLRGGNIVVNFGDMSNMNLKIQFLPEILKDVGNKKGTILMNSDEDNLKPRFFEKI